MQITEALKRFRRENRLSQKDIAEVLNTTPQNVYRYEKVNSAISAESIIKLADAYNVSTDYLLGRIDTPRHLNNSVDKKQLQEFVRQFGDILGVEVRLADEA